jgi:hypothetical protein
MRSILAFSLLITLCGSASAATVHPAHRRHAPNQGMIASDPASGFAYAPPVQHGASFDGFAGCESVVGRDKRQSD